MSDEGNKSTKQMLNALGQLIAIIIIVRYGLVIVNHYVPFLTNETVLTILDYIYLYAPIALVTVVGLEAVWDKSDILKLVVAVICAAVIIISFLPGVKESILTTFNLGGITSANL